MGTRVRFGNENAPPAARLLENLEWQYFAYALDQNGDETIRMFLEENGGTYEVYQVVLPGGKKKEAVVGVPTHLLPRFIGARNRDRAKFRIRFFKRRGDDGKSVEIKQMHRTDTKFVNAKKGARRLVLTKKKAV